MKKGISLVALVITIIVLIILTAAVIWTGADTPEQTKLAVFYNDIATVQDAVTLKILTNVANMETEEWTAGATNGEYSKYFDILPAADYNGDIVATADGDAAGAILSTATVDAELTIDGITDPVKVYGLDGTAAAKLGLSMSATEITKFGIDADGRVYYMPGVYLFPNDEAKKTNIYVTKDLIATAGCDSPIVITAY